MIYSILAGLAAIYLTVIAFEFFHYDMPSEGLTTMLLAIAAVLCI